MILMIKQKLRFLILCVEADGGRANEITESW